MNLLLINCSEYFFDFKEENTEQVLRIETKRTLTGTLFNALKRKVEYLTM